MAMCGGAAINDDVRARFARTVMRNLPAGFTVSAARRRGRRPEIGRAHV